VGAEYSSAPVRVVRTSTVRYEPETAPAASSRTRRLSSLLAGSMIRASQHQAAEHFVAASSRPEAKHVVRTCQASRNSPSVTRWQAGARLGRQYPGPGQAHPARQSAAAAPTATRTDPRPPARSRSWSRRRPPDRRVGAVGVQSSYTPVVAAAELHRYNRRHLL
jgi:hypothetical protein